MSGRLNIYVCSTTAEKDLMGIFIQDLHDHHNVTVVDDNIMHTDFKGKEKILDKKMEAIQKADIILAIIEDSEHHYADTFAEISIGCVLKKSIIVFDNSECADQTTRIMVVGTPPSGGYRGIGTGLKGVGNRIIQTIPTYWGRTVIHTRSWDTTKKTITQIQRFLGSVSEYSDSE